MNRIDFSEAIKHVKNPAKITLAIMKTPKDNFNMITLEWFMRTSIKPAMFAISIGHTRYSYECLQQTDSFNLCFPSAQMASTARIAGSKSGRDIDKFEVINEQWFPGRFRGLPVFKKAAANFECEIVTQVRSGDHTIYVGEVKYSWIEKTNNEILTYKNL
ncbi:MAG: flavin reductase family protein [Candidatus Cloacimonadota bacterium]|nr:flavin reductase family protein [Candidatus Cloacimonadota bacterium]